MGDKLKVSNKRNFTFWVLNIVPAVGLIICLYFGLFSDFKIERNGVIIKDSVQALRDSFPIRDRYLRLLSPGKIGDISYDEYEEDNTKRLKEIKELVSELMQQQIAPQALLIEREYQNASYNSLIEMNEKLERKLSLLSNNFNNFINKDAFYQHQIDSLKIILIKQQICIDSLINNKCPVINLKRLNPFRDKKAERVGK